MQHNFRASAPNQALISIISSLTLSINLSGQSRMGYNCFMFPVSKLVLKKSLKVYPQEEEIHTKAWKRMRGDLISRMWEDFEIQAQDGREACSTLGKGGCRFQASPDTICIFHKSLPYSGCLPVVTVIIIIIINYLFCKYVFHCFLHVFFLFTLLEKE